MHIYYISPSSMPSRTANSIHVSRMCEAINLLDHQVTLFIHRTEGQAQDIKNKIEDFYQIKLPTTQVISCKPLVGRGINLFICFIAIWTYLTRCFGSRKPDFIISRNLYASLFFSIINPSRLAYETHQIETGYQGKIQSFILKNKKVQCIVISDALKDLLRKTHQIDQFNPAVLHDAAPCGVKVLNQEQKRTIQNNLLGTETCNQFQNFAGYFGHLYPGRGIDIIIELSKLHPEVAFLVFGGNKQQIEELKESNQQKNLFIMGFIQPKHAIETMSAMNILLMPYQKDVSIGAKHLSTAEWMSPMKMFEYMSTGTPIISSDLPVLKEVLKHQSNSLLAIPDQANDWSLCLKQILQSEDKGDQLGKQAHKEYLEEYNWVKRSEALIALMN